MLTTKKIKVNIYSQLGEKMGEEELEPSIFGVPVKEGLVKQAVVAQMANARQVLAHTKDKSEVRGGGRKPWRQKGTGRARHGSIRSPLWIGGGVTFGPTKERNFSQKINKKMKRKALFMCLSDKVAESKFIVLDKIELSKAKTKEMVKLLKNLKSKVYKFKKEDLDSKKGSTLVVLPESNLNVKRAANNLPNLKTVRADSLNVVDVLKYNYLLLPKDSIKKISETYGKRAENKK
jgi:large subunit ribosomal protein L4